MRHRVFATVSLLIVALATGRGEPLSPNPVRARHTDGGAGAAVQGGTRQTQASDLVDAATGELRYRMIGPHRGGRTKAAAGIADQPNVFYIGVVNGGVWKTTDYGRTWTPIFDDQPTGSIGAIAVPPSNPDIIYVGSGEGLQRPDLSVGKGTTSPGTAGAHGRISTSATVSRFRRSPWIRSPDRLFVAVLGHPYGASDADAVTLEITDAAGRCLHL